MKVTIRDVSSVLLGLGAAQTFATWIDWALNEHSIYENDVMQMLFGMSILLVAIGLRR